MGWEEILLFSVFIIPFFSEINPVFLHHKTFFSDKGLFLTLFFKQIFLFKSNTGPTGVDGTNCPGACPTVCPSNDLTCQGNVNDNGCDMPQFCLPSTGMYSSLSSKNNYLANHKNCTVVGSLYQFMCNSRPNRK